MPLPAKARAFVPVALLVLVLDVVTKRWASANLVERFPQQVVGDLLRWSLTHNTGAAMGITLGSWSRMGFTLLTIIMVAFLFGIYREGKDDDVPIGVATGAIIGGAIGNLIDRLRWERGVVDFIDVGIGDTRFWTFNVADMGVSCGAVALALLLWRREQPAPATPAAPTTPAGPTDAE